MRDQAQGGGLAGAGLTADEGEAAVVADLVLQAGTEEVDPGGGPQGLGRDLG